MKTPDEAQTIPLDILGNATGGVNYAYAHQKGKDTALVGGGGGALVGGTIGMFGGPATGAVGAGIGLVAGTAGGYAAGLYKGVYDTWGK